MLEIKIDASSANPLYQQIVEQIKNHINGGRLKHGEQIPSVRDLASWLQLNPSTVARAYNDLKQEGLVVTSCRRGTIINGNKNIEPQSENPPGWKFNNGYLQRQFNGSNLTEIETAFTLQPSYWRVQRQG